MSSSFQVVVWLTADELELLRARLPRTGEATTLAYDALDEKLSDAQRRIRVMTAGGNTAPS